MARGGVDTITIMIAPRENAPGFDTQFVFSPGVTLEMGRVACDNVRAEFVAMSIKEARQAGRDEALADTEAALKDTESEGASEADN